jgi:beta-lactamase class C
MEMRKTSFTAVLAFCFYTWMGAIPCKAPETGASTQYLALNPALKVILPEYEESIQFIMQELGLPGAAVGIATADSIFYLKGFGLRSITDSLKIDTETVFRLASLSKGFTSSIAALYVHEGRFGWDDAVSSLLPDFQPQDEYVRNHLTVSDVLSHRTGWVSHAYDNLVNSGKDTPALFRELADLKPLHRPGEVYAYQNVAFSLAGEIIGNISGSSFGDEIKNRFFIPLGMDHASTGWQKYQTSANRARPHRASGGIWHVRPDRINYYRVSPAAGVNASVSDMIKWLQAQMGARPDVLPPEILHDIHSRKVITPGERRRYRWSGGQMYYGLGWRILRFRGHDMIFHSGGLDGFFSQIGWIPDLGVGIVVLHNSRRTDAMLPDFFGRLLDVLPS